MLGTLGRVFQRVTELLDGRVEAVVEVHEGVTRPELLPQLLTRDQLTRPLQQQSQDPERLLLERDLAPVAAQLA
jgi:hypothetical protein